MSGSPVADSGGAGLLPFNQHKQQLFVTQRNINQRYHLVPAHLLSSFPRLFAGARELVQLLVCLEARRVVLEEERDNEGN